MVTSGHFWRFWKKNEAKNAHCIGDWEYGECSGSCSLSEQTQTFIITQEKVGSGIDCEYSHGYTITEVCDFTCPIEGCTDPAANNYISYAELDDGKFQFCNHAKSQVK